MKTITFPVGYRPNYLIQFLDSLSSQDLSGYEIFCSAENHPECIEILKRCVLPLNILYKQNSSGAKSHSGARDNMYNVLSHVFKCGTEFNVHLEDDFLLSPDAINLVNWYYETFKNDPLAYLVYGLFNHESCSDDYEGLEVISVFEGLGWCIFKQAWELCIDKFFFDDSLAKKHFKTYGWDWALMGAFKEYGYKALRPFVARTNHNGRIDGTCCTVDHHDKHYAFLQWNKTKKIKEFLIRDVSIKSEELVLKYKI